ncbi:MAG: dephospho-CoA kinase [Lachnospiraceae bacterium]|nr:dephospho-CoA kinase [Lachnospiraceae bacterium]
MILGITGGIGNGKSTVLKILQEQYHFAVFEADRIAHELMMPGNKIFDSIVEAFGTEILNPDGVIDRMRFGAIVFSDASKLERLNQMVHPSVIDEISCRIHQLRQEQPDTNFVIEAALLIESGCYKICDRLWYIDTRPEIRRERLKRYRGYTDEKIQQVIANQLKKEEFLKYADDVIDNSFSIEETAAQIEKKLVLSGNLC